MKKVYLVRHGKAGRFTDIGDFDRILEDTGKDESLQVAGRLKDLQKKPSLIISSPAVRALETARIFADQLEYRQIIRKRKALYEQADDSLLSVVHSIDDKFDSIMIVGHNPSMEYFAQFLIKGFKEHIPTGGVVGIVLKTNSWKEVSRRHGKLELFDYPHKVKKKVSKKSIRKNLEAKLAEQIGNFLNEVDTDVKNKLEKSIKKSSKEIAKEFIKKQRQKKSK
ncbi:histidine phosphatase family protein [Candidatus Latescibacterota bacterium]